MRALKALQAAELRMGGSRAAEPEARTAETVGERTAEEGLATGRTSSRPSARPRWNAEPMARRERGTGTRAVPPVEAAGTLTPEPKRRRESDA